MVAASESQGAQKTGHLPSAESIIEIVVRDTAASTGQNFFEDLVRSIASALKVRHCLLTELLENGQLRTLAFWSDGQIADNITYDPAPGPCGVVLAKDIYYCPTGVQQLFPHQPALPLLEADSYVGVSLRTHQGEVLGNLVVLDSQPILERKLHEDLLQLFAARASAELERKNAISALKKLNTELEMRVENRTIKLANQAEELQQALTELQQTQSRLIQSEKMSALGRLVGGVAHEINNPITFIQGNFKYVSQNMQALLKLVNLYDRQHLKPTAEIEALHKSLDLDYLAEDLPKLFASMKSGAERIQKIVQSLRTFSRLDESDYKSIDLHANLDSVLSLLQDKLHPQADGSNIRLIKRYGDFPSIECYPGQLNQVIMNLLYNAIEAVQEKGSQLTNQQGRSAADFQGTICVATELVQPNSIVIRIVDNGLGIPETIQKNIFDPFFTTKQVGQGMGLGLSTSYQIITEKHEGRLECFSSLGQGSEFVISIPLSHSSVSTQP